MSELQGDQQLSPQAEANPLESKISHQEGAINWATRAFEQYRNLPKTDINHKERVRIDSLVKETARQLLTNPENIDIATGVWKSRERLEGATEERKESFYESVKKAGAKLMKEKWQSYDEKKLAGIVRAYANSVLCPDFAQELLKGYFGGPPDSIVKRIEARYKFASSTLDLADDQKAFRKAARIGFFADDSVLPRTSSYFLDTGSLKSFAYNVNDAQLQQFMVTENVLQSCAIAASEDVDSLVGQNRIFAETDLEYKNRLEKEEGNARRRLGEKEYASRNKQLLNFYSASVVSKKGYLELKKSWPGKFFFDETEPLRQKCRSLMGSKVDFREVQKRILAQARTEKIENVFSLALQSPGGHVMNIFMPEALMDKKNEIIQKALSLASLPDVANILNINDPSLTSFSSTRISMDNSVAFLVMRRRSPIEGNPHPLQTLEAIGFPSVQPKGVGSLESVNEKLADEIRRRQMIFLNKRGVRIPLTHSVLNKFGYSDLYFCQDTADPEKILVKICVGEAPYSVKLDRNFNFDFEGKQFDSPVLYDSLKFTLLSYLRPILCEKKAGDKDEDQLLGIARHMVRVRSPYLRWAPEKFRGTHYYTHLAEEKCMKYQGKDLCTLVLERMEEFKGTDRDGLECTYVKPVEKNAEEVPPLTLSLPDPLRA